MDAGWSSNTRMMLPPVAKVAIRAACFNAKTASYSTVQWQAWCRLGGGVSALLFAVETKLASVRRQTSRVS